MTHWAGFTGSSSGLSLPLVGGVTKYSLHWHALYILAGVAALSYPRSGTDVLDPPGFDVHAGEAFKVPHVAGDEHQTVARRYRGDLPARERPLQAGS